MTLSPYRPARPAVPECPFQIGALSYCDLPPDTGAWVRDPAAGNLGQKFVPAEGAPADCRVSALMTFMDDLTDMAHPSTRQAVIRRGHIWLGLPVPGTDDIAPAAMSEWLEGTVFTFVTPDLAVSGMTRDGGVHIAATGRPPQAGDAQMLDCHARFLHMFTYTGRKPVPLWLRGF